MIELLQKNVKSDGHNAYSLFKCFCGKQFECRNSRIKTGRQKSCGCEMRKRESNGTTTIKKNYKVRPEYNSWRAMHKRCYNPKEENYKWYGGRGIEVCPEWKKFVNFYSDMGERPEGMTLDRIDPDGSYTPSNCRWSDYKTQTLNRRMNR